MIPWHGREAVPATPWPRHSGIVVMRRGPDAIVLRIIRRRIVSAELHRRGVPIGVPDREWSAYP